MSFCSTHTFSFGKIDESVKDLFSGFSPQEKPRNVFDFFFAHTHTHTHKRRKLAPTEREREREREGFFFNMHASAHLHNNTHTKFTTLQKIEQKNSRHET